MKQLLALVLLVVLAFSQSACQSSLPTASHPKSTSGFQDLFAQDFSNANMEPAWKWDNGVLSATDHGTLWTKDSYGNFVLDLEFKVDPKANSGIFIRTANPKDILSALEIQVHETGDGTPHGQVGALYDLMSPVKNAAKPAGEWNHYTITAKDNMLYVVLNGQQVINADLNTWTTPRVNPDGSKNKFSRAIKDQARSGPIGLQGVHGQEGSNVYFRNLKIKRLD